MRRPGSILMFGAVLVAGCGGGSGGDVLVPVVVDLSGFMPFNPGDDHHFTTTSSDSARSTERRVVGAPISVPEMPDQLHPVTRTIDGRPVETAYWSAVPALGHQLHAKWRSEEDAIDTLSPPLTIPRFLEVGVSQGQSIQVTTSRAGTDSVRQMLVELTMKGIETVKVPAGTFAGCARLHLSETLVGDHGEVVRAESTTVLLAPRVGVVKETRADTTVELASMSFNARTFLPLRPGDVYVYVDLDTGAPPEIVVKTVGSPIGAERFPVTVTPVVEVVEGIVNEIGYFTSDAIEGYAVFGEDDLEDGCEMRLLPGALIPHGLTPGQSWMSTSTVTIAGHRCLTASRLTQVVTFETLHSVTVPAGTFDGCARLRIVTTLWDADGGGVDQEEVFFDLAPNVGLVKEIEPDSVAELVGASLPGRSF